MKVKLKIKIIITALLSLAALLPMLTVFSKSNDYSVNKSDSFYIGYTGGSLKTVAEILDVTEKELNAKCRENNILFVAVNKDNTAQIRLSRYTTELSKKAGDISVLSDELLEDLSPEIDGFGYIKTTIGGTVFLKVEEKLKDNGGEYTSKQYITIKNGYVYQISVYASDAVAEVEANEFTNGIKIIGATIYSPKQKIIVVCSIAAFLVLIIIMIRGIIKDLKS